MKQGTPEWLAARRLGIGGSDAPAILGVSPWLTPFDVWADKTGLQDGVVVETEPMRWGTIMEPLVRAEYERVTGLCVHVVGDIQRHPQHPWMLGSLDGRAEDGRIVEIKTTRNGQGWGEPGTDEIPLHYLPQVHHYLIVTGAPLADVVVLIGGSDFRIYHVEPDPELHGQIIEAEAQFWDRVQRQQPPEAVTLRDAVRRWGRLERAGAVTASTEVIAAVEALRSLKAEADAIEARQEAAKAVVMKVLGDVGDSLFDDAGHLLATWKLSKGASRLDAKAIAAAHPEIASKFTTTSAPSRRFLLK